MKFLLLAVMLSAQAARSQDFEQLLDSRAFLSQARMESTSIGRRDTDCATVSLGHNEEVSQYVSLRSTEWYEECYWVPGDPRRGGGHRQCYTRPGRTYHENARVRVTERKALLPWERDTFRLCLSGPWLDARPVATAYKYRQAGSTFGEVTFAPGEKQATKPDPAGIAVESLTPALVLTLKDRWASYYAGERLKLKLTVVEEVRNWPDATVGTLETETASGGELYALALAQHLGGKLKAGKKYYVKVAFRRLGRVSKDDQVDAGKSATVAYQPSAAGVAAR